MTLRFQPRRFRALRSSAWVVDAGLQPRVSEGMQRGGRSEINLQMSFDSACIAHLSMKNKGMNEIKILTKEEAAALPYDANWIGTLSRNAKRTRLATKGEAIGWVKRVRRDWPGQWAVYECYHYATGESIGWGATAL